MASLEQKDLVNYTVKKFEDVYQEISRDYTRQNLNKLSNKIKKLEDKVRKLNIRILSLECRILNDKGD